MNELESSGLDEIYFDIDSATDRYRTLTDVFKTNYCDQTPDFYCRSPGRVNIIGDHIDYSFFPCLPAAISFDVAMAVRVVRHNDSTGKCGFVRLVNTGGQFEAQEFKLEYQAEISGKSWVNYFKCSYNTVRKYLHERGLESDLSIAGLEVAVCGNVPACSGLSSSAAFVVCGTIANMLCFGPKTSPIDKFSLTELSATCEQLVGVNSGGMDQAASIFGKKDMALFINFRPDLSITQLKFQRTHDPLVLLIANSLVVSAKLETAPIHYNLRVVEVTIAANVLAAKLGGLRIPQDGNLQAGTLYGVLISRYNEVTINSLTNILCDVNNVLKVEGYSEHEVSRILECTVHELRVKFMSKFPVKFDTLKLYQRAKHVYEESLRVLLFVKAMYEGSSPRLLGNLMNDSHKSAQCLFENSHPDCDLLCKIALNNGSLGSRVTGAGWGGCTVHLVPSSQVEKVKTALLSEYYAVKRCSVPTDALIETRPSSGTAIFSSLNI